MKQLLTIFSVLLFSVARAGEIDKIGVAGPVVFNNVSFALASSETPNEKYYLQEYLPNGESFENFRQLMSVHFFRTGLSTEDAVRQKVKELEKRKEMDDICNYKVNESPDGKEFIVDFILGEDTEEGLAIAEFNIYRYRQVDIGNGEKGILVYAYSKRGYGDDIKPFLSSLETERVVLLNQMIDAQLPLIKLMDN